jgi:ribosomal protein S18 acetylase RimI-like enzyme
MLPHPGQLLVDYDEQHRLNIQLFSTLARFDLRYIQALCEPDAVPLRRLLEGCGLARLTRLHYLARDHDARRRVDDSGGEWVQYCASTHRLFADTIEQTYVESQDCPELCGLRTMDDVIASHRVAWTFKPATWEVLLRDGRPAGCVLQNLVAPRATEIAYLGVTPAFRRQGVGTALVTRALWHAQRSRCTAVSVVVDGRNGSARRLYARFGFSRTAERDAHLRFLTQPHRTP